MLEKSHTGDASKTKFDLTFNYLEDEDIQVATKASGANPDVFTTRTLGTDYTISNKQVVFTSAPANNTAIRIRRQTKVKDPRHVFYAGSTVTAQGLNKNTRQVLYALEERSLGTDDTSDLALATGNHTHIRVNGATDWEIIDGVVDANALASNAVTGAKIADDAVDSEHYVADSIDTEHYAPGSVDATALATNAVTTVKIDADAVTSAKIADDQINSEHIAAGAIDLEHMSSESVDEDNLVISNAGTNGNFLQKQSGNTGGLTWAAPGSTGYASVSDNTARTFSDDTWTAVGLSIAYTPSFASSKILLNAYVDLYPKGRADSASTQFAWFRWRMRLDGSSTVGPEQFVRHGHGHSGTYDHYNTEKKWQWHFWREYTNNNTNQKTFSVELYETGNSILQMNTDLDSSGVGTSYFTITELAV